MYAELAHENGALKEVIEKSSESVDRGAVRQLASLSVSVQRS